MSDLIGIGQFARLSQLSVKMLRYQEGRRMIVYYSGRRGWRASLVISLVTTAAVWLAVIVIALVRGWT